MKPEGYDPKFQVLSTQLMVSDFILGSVPVKALGEYNKFVWDDSPQCELWRVHALTKAEILHCCNDLKVSGNVE